MPEDHAHHAILVDQSEPPRPKTVRARHAASLVVYRTTGAATDMLMGMRGGRHRFMPNRLVFPGGAVDRADLTAVCATPLSAQTQALLRKKANPHLAHGLGIAAARELREETGLTLGDVTLGELTLGELTLGELTLGELTLGAPPRLDALMYLARAVTPPGSPIRFNARFLTVSADQVSGELGGDGELDSLRFYGMQEALALDLALPTRRVLERLRDWLELSAQERAAITHTPVMLRDRGWVME